MVSECYALLCANTLKDLHKTLNGEKNPTMHGPEVLAVSYFSFETSVLTIVFRVIQAETTLTNL